MLSLSKKENLTYFTLKHNRTLICGRHIIQLPAQVIQKPEKVSPFCFISWNVFDAPLDEVVTITEANQ